MQTGKWRNGFLEKHLRIICLKSIAWRQKEQFSDGVGYSWIDTLKAVAEEEVTDEDVG